ncbi:acyltransferase [Azospirillum sp. SYSU D00513]|uniref:acyltransferase family protein n=1 Tax=Azospirillum sp. SYSU D00513 TaxID=2812561 RepID=UPI001A973A84|nr:acyltransferase [Azospirillum sp. SYSU D00513]
MLRLLLIIGIMVIHIPFGQEDNPYRADRSGFDWLVLYLREGFFRAGVPCLSVISGWLLARGGGRGYAALVSKKSRTLMIPYLAFSLATFAMVFGLQAVGMGTHWKPIAAAGNLELANMLFGLTEPPINIALYFLRDMMLCVLLSPILLWAAVTWPRAGLALLLGFALTEPAGLLPEGLALLFIRPDILLFFYAGLAMALRGWDVTRWDRHFGAALLGCLFGAVATVALRLYGTELPVPVTQGLALGLKLAISLSVWILSARLAATAAGRAIARNGDKAFWLFCTHVPFLRLLFMVWGLTAIPYEAFYLLVVPVALVMLLPALSLMQALLPGLTAFLLGTRSAGRRATGQGATDAGLPTEFPGGAPLRQGRN